MDFKGGCMRNAECLKWVSGHCQNFKKREDKLPEFSEYMQFCQIDVNCMHWVKNHCKIEVA